MPEDKLNTDEVLAAIEGLTQAVDRLGAEARTRNLFRMVKAYLANGQNPEAYRLLSLIAEELHERVQRDRA